MEGSVNVIPDGIEGNTVGDGVTDVVEDAVAETVVVPPEKLLG